MLDRNVIDQLHHVNRLANTGTTEQANLAALAKHEIDYLDCLK